MARPPWELPTGHYRRQQEARAWFWAPEYWAQVRQPELQSQEPELLLPERALQAWEEEAAEAAPEQVPAAVEQQRPDFEPVWNGILLRF